MRLIVYSLLIFLLLIEFKFVISRRIDSISQLEDSHQNPNIKTKLSFETVRVHRSSTKARTGVFNNSTAPSHDRVRKKLRQHPRDGVNAWFHCADGSKPREVSWENNDQGVMCGREYPSHSCCSRHDLTVDLLGSKVRKVDKISIKKHEPNN